MEISSDKNSKSPQSIAEEAKKRADSDIKVSVICCKYDPDYLSAVPNYERAAKNYALVKDYKEEIYCREKLALCHRHLKDTYSEGTNLEKVANIYIQNLNLYEEAFVNIKNATLAFRLKGDYQYEMNALIKLALNYREKKELDYAEKTLQLAHEEILKIAHIVTLDKEHSYDYIYKAMTAYCVVLILQNKLKETISTCQDFIKVFEEFEDNKALIINFYGLIVISHILTEDYDMIDSVFKESKNICQKASDFDTMNNIYDCWTWMKEGNEEKFNLALRIVDVDYDNALIKKFKEFYKYYQGKKLKDVGKQQFEEISLTSKKSGKETDIEGKNFADAQL